MFFVYTLKIDSRKEFKVKIMVKHCIGIATAVFLTACFAFAVQAQTVLSGEKEIVRPRSYEPLKLTASTVLQTMVDQAVAEIMKSNKGLEPGDLAVTLIDLREPANLRFGQYRGQERIYPASVVKAFYLAAVHQQLEDGKLKITPELERGLRDMIVTSSNEATQYIVDVLTDTSSGGEMPVKEFELWSYRRNRMNRYFASMGYANINVNQKTHCEDAYGVEQQFRNYKGENRNMLTSNSSARLMADIALGRLVNRERSSMMMDLLKRDPFAEGKAVNSQAVDFTGKALIDRKMTGARLWSKAGWTSRNRHDAAYVETPDGLKFAIAVFTENRSNDKEIIPSIVGKLIDQMRDTKE